MTVRGSDFSYLRVVLSLEQGLTISFFCLFQEHTRIKVQQMETYRTVVPTGCGKTVSPKVVCNLLHENELTNQKPAVGLVKLSDGIKSQNRK